MITWLKQIFDDLKDPVKNCDLYKDHSAGSCNHVDGWLCYYPGCEMLEEYKANRQ